MLRLAATTRRRPLGRGPLALLGSTSSSGSGGGRAGPTPPSQHPSVVPGPLRCPARALGSKAGGGGDGAPPHADLFLAELFGGVVNKPRNGTVVQVQEASVARLSGLREARIHDLVSIGEEGVRGLVFDLEQNTVAVALLDKELPEEGTDAALSGQVPAIPVGDALLGRVVDPLGRPIPGLDPWPLPSTAEGKTSGESAAAAAPLEAGKVAGAIPLLHKQPPGIMARKPLCRLLPTGVKALDVFHSMGHGQCFAVIGRRGSGKTTLALQVVMNQRERAMAEGAPFRCVYVAIGQEESAVKRAVDLLRKEGCLGYVTVVAATLDMQPGLRYLAPFAACALGEHWRDQGGQALVVVDDLSRHAEAYSELAKFMAKPEVETGLALHGPLLERFAQLSDAKGGGAMSGLVLVEGEANEGEAGNGLAHRINSIVDHAINLNLDLARKKAFPAVDVTYQMNLQSPGMALLPEPARALVHNLRVTLAEAMDDEAGAKMAEELGIQVDDEAEEAKVERLNYLGKVRLLFRQGLRDNVDDGGLLLYLLCCLKPDMLLDLDADTVKQLDAVLAAELPKAKGWKKLRTQVEALAGHEDARTIAEAFLQAHQSRQGHRGLGGKPALPLSASASIGPATQSTAKEAENVYGMLHDILFKAVNYSRKKTAVAKLTAANESGGGSSIRDRYAAALNVKRKR